MNKSGIGSHTRPNAGLTDSWITPKFIIDELGPFDLDPCAASPQPWPCAPHAYNETDDGLSRTWFGRVWCNPPYSQAGMWLDRLATHGHGTALIFARTETEMFINQVWDRATSVLFIHGRLFFHHTSGERAAHNSGGPSVLVAYGDDDAAALCNSKIRGSFVRAWEIQ